MSFVKRQKAYLMFTNCNSVLTSSELLLNYVDFDTDGMYSITPLVCDFLRILGLTRTWSSLWLGQVEPTIYTRIITDERDQRGKPMPVRSTKEAKDSSYYWGSLVGGTGGDQFHVKLALIRKYVELPKIKSQAQFLSGVKLFPVPIGLTWEHDILVLKPSPCLHNENEVDDWMILDEWNSWFKSQVRYSSRNQDIVNLNKFKTIKNYGRNSTMSMDIMSSK
ncbi:uncharacterized protein TNCV_2734501 [Trichonephila clavipes]|nr:uncharacterized protein TNCV_2734501 [Trichonephila clavipes]